MISHESLQDLLHIASRTVDFEEALKSEDVRYFPNTTINKESEVVHQCLRDWDVSHYSSMSH